MLAVWGLGLAPGGPALLCCLAGAPGVVAIASTEDYTIASRPPREPKVASLHVMGLMQRARLALDQNSWAPLKALKLDTLEKALSVQPKGGGS